MADKRLLYAYKGGRCAHCGKTVEDVLAAFGTVSQIFHFNHVKPDNKHPDYDNVIRRVVSSEVLDELDKCVLLCSFCHGILHGQDGKGTLTITSEIRGKRVSQTVTGQIIIQFTPDDSGKPRLSFFTDEDIKIIPYKVYRGGKKPKILTRGELEHRNLLLRYMLETKSGKQLLITNLSGRQLFHALKADDDHLKVTAHYGFSPVGATLADDNGKPACWVRKGRAIFKSGTIEEDGEYSFLAEYQELSKVVGARDRDALGR